MKLQTTVDIVPPQHKISHQSKLLLIGSCFTENIGVRLSDYKFSTVLNPCGIAYNPASVSKTIALITGATKIQSKDFILHDEQWHSLHHHGSFSRTTKDDVQQTISEALGTARKQLEETSHIFLTMGTAWVFEHSKTQQIVNNCHKLPAANFKRRKLSVAEIVTHLQEAIAHIRTHNAKAELTFTVSPVRHLKDGLHENQLSKAALLLAIAALQQQDTSLRYFPAYEIAVDELRDYRFFAEDFAHLNYLGIQYVWERFSANYISKKSQALFPILAKLQKALQHKVNDSQSVAHQKFIAKTQNLINELEQVIPDIDFSPERKRLQDVE